MQQYGSAEAITSCAWLNETSAPLLIAGMGGKWLRLYDIRCTCSYDDIICLIPFCSYTEQFWTL
jgi:hypothetical protein